MNKDRSELRRKPQKIQSVKPEFNENVFNFNKADSNEILFNVLDEDSRITFLINNSPLTKFHSLIVPDMINNQSQIIDKNCIKFGIHLIFLLNQRAFRVGYNSPGAMASVNHLHMHLLYIEEVLFVENIVSIFILLVKSLSNCRFLTESSSFKK